MDIQTNVRTFRAREEHGQMEKWTSARCPRCNALQEDKEHITRCPQEAANGTWTEALKTLEAWLKHKQMDPQLTTVLTTRLQAWWTGNPPPQDLPTAQQQTRIGWDKVIDGWLTLAWREHQEAYWAQWKHHKSSKRWTMELIKKLWNIMWDMWDHWNKALHNSEVY